MTNPIKVGLWISGMGLIVSLAFSLFGNVLAQSIESPTSLPLGSVVSSPIFTLKTTTPKEKSAQSKVTVSAVPTAFSSSKVYLGGQAKSPIFPLNTARLASTTEEISNSIIPGGSNTTAGR